MRALFFALLFASSAATAQVPAEPAATAAKVQAESLSQAAPTPARALAADDLGTWLDGFLPWALARGDLAGAVVTVVKDGQVLFARGYGYADLAKRTPVDPANTLFRIASISKTFTWTAVMQLVEQGRLDLDKDVNAYLDFKIPEAFGKPITLRHIMTHSAGFEETSKDLFLAAPAKLLPLGEYVRTHIPARAYPPGEVAAYSNYATALAGHIVERVSGQSFEDYIEQHIYAPLGMDRATFRQPLPDALQPYMAQGYALASGPAGPFELMTGFPAGSMSVSGLDMAKFMIAHLNQGGPLLKPATAARMVEPQTPSAPGFRPMALGFYHEDRNGRRIVGHSGDLLRFHSDLHLLLDEKVGLFVSFNSAGKEGVTGPLRTALFRGFVDRYFPAPPQPDEPTLPTAGAHGREVAGAYSSSRAGVESWYRFTQMFSPARLTVNADDTISVSSLRSADGAIKKWREVQPYVWREVNGTGRVTVLRDADGRAATLVTDDLPPVMVFRRSGFWTGPNAMPVVGASVAVLLLTVLAWPVAALVRRHYGLKLRFEGRDRQLYRAARIACCALVLFLVGWQLVLNSFSGGFGMTASSRDWVYWLIRLIGLIGLLGTPLLIWRAVHAWRDARFGWWGRIATATVAAAALVVVCAAFAYNLLSFGLQY